jgi:hypothetical protein
VQGARGFVRRRSEEADVHLKRLDLCELRFNPNVVAGSPATSRSAAHSRGA